MKYDFSSSEVGPLWRSDLLKKGIILFELVLLGIFLFWRFQLGLTRYFDIDEFAYLHWGYSVYIGEHPYTDFFYFLPPFFLYPIAFLFAVLGRSVVVLGQARMLIFFIFLLTAAVLFLIGKKLKNIQTGLLAVLLFAFLPLPSDKMIEIRPDLVALFFSLSGLYLFILGEEKKRWKYFFFSGVFYASSIGFVPKTIFFLIPAVLIFGYKLYQPDGGNRRINEPFLFLLGACLPVLILLLLMFSYGNPTLAFYSITKLSAEITKILGNKFYMRPDIFFYPNDTYYGLPGYSPPLLINLVIYITASIWAIFRLIQSLSYPDNKKCLREFLFAASFWLNLYAFVYIYPLKHAQYLITVAPFIAFYFADLMNSIVRSKFVRKFRIGTLFSLLLLSLVFWTGKIMYEKKIQWNNKSSLEKIIKLFKAIPPQAAVFDLTGESIFYPNGYYFCCLPYGQYYEAFLFKIPDLEKDLQRRNTKFIHTGWFDKIYDLPPNQTKYIKDHFIPYFSDGDGSLLVRK